MVDQSQWLEISLIVSDELAEAVSEVLSRHVPGGIVIERAANYNTRGEKDVMENQVRISCYLSVNSEVEVKRSHIEQSLWHLSAIEPLPKITYQIIRNQNWMEKWKEFYRPILAGERLLILPPWLDNPYPQRIPIMIDPNMAFGTGAHPTTQLCLKLLERNLRPGQDAIDIGCGSGILSIAARLLGARYALAVDIDPLSVQATNENGKRNGINGGLEVGLGSVADIKHGCFKIREAPLVLANILSSVLLSLLDDGLGDLVSPGGILILSGILDHQEVEVLQAVKRHGLILSSREQYEDWVTLALAKPFDHNSVDDNG